MQMCHEKKNPEKNKFIILNKQIDFLIFGHSFGGVDFWF